MLPWQPEFNPIIVLCSSVCAGWRACFFGLKPDFHRRHMNQVKLKLKYAAVCRRVRHNLTSYRHIPRRWEMKMDTALLFTKLIVPKHSQKRGAA